MSKTIYCKNCPHERSEHFAPDGSAIKCQGERTIDGKVYESAEWKRCECEKFEPIGGAAQM